MFWLQIIFPFLTALVITAIATPLTIKLANRYKLIDNPEMRPHPAHVQARIIPRAGGLPIYLGILLAVLFFVHIDKHLLGILIGSLVLLIMGLLDDKLSDFSPYSRLILQLFSVAIVVASGIGIAFISNPLGGLIHLDQIIIPINFLGPHRIILFADLLAFFWIVWVMNIVNFSKGVDGQMPGIISVAAITIGVLSLKLFFHGDPNQITIATLSFIIAGSSLGFLFFNWHPSKIIPGFSGSNILGFMVAVLSILSGAKVATAILVLLIPTVDFIYLVITRILRGQSPMRGDANHLHHKLLNLGWSHPKISLFYIFTCAILGTLAAILPNEEKSFTVIGVGAVAFGIILWLQHYLEERISSGRQ